MNNATGTYVELQARIAKLETAIAFVLDKFKRDEADGYHSRDRQFAIDILNKALAAAGKEKP